MIELFFITLLILSFWELKTVSVFLIVVLLLINIILYLGQRGVSLKKLKYDKSELNNYERKLLKKYRFYFHWTSLSKELFKSSVWAYVCCFLVIIMLLISQSYLEALIILVNILFFSSFFTKLNPRSILHDTVEIRERQDFSEELRELEILCKKLKKQNKDIC